MDALRVRGYTVILRTGRNAHTALQRSQRRDDVDLRVVFSPEALDPDVHRRLMTRLDPEYRGDVMLIALDRPLDAVHAIERAKSRSGPRTVRMRSTRAILANRTLVEHKLEFGRWWQPALASAATFALVTAAFVTTAGPLKPSTSSSRASAPLDPAPVSMPAPITARRRGDVTLAAMRPGALETIDEDFDDGFDASFDEDDLDDEILIFDDSDAMMAAEELGLTVTDPSPATLVSIATDERSTALDPALPDEPHPLGAELTITAASLIESASTVTEATDGPIEEAPITAAEPAEDPAEPAATPVAIAQLQRPHDAITLADPFAGL